MNVRSLRRIKPFPSPHNARRTATRRLRTLGVAAIGVLAAAAARAENPLFDLGPFSFSWLANSGAGVFTVPNANFGAGSFDQTKAELPRATTPVWAEGFIKPEIRVNTHNSAGSFFADVSAIYAQTVGDGDAALFSFTPGNPGAVRLEEAYLGWTGDVPLLNTGDSVTAQFGRQNFVVDDGFLIQDGTYDAGKRGAYYNAPRAAFDGWGVLKLNSDPVRVDLFVLRNTIDQHLTRYNDGPIGTFEFDYPRAAFAGFDAQYFKTADVGGADGSVNYADRKWYYGVTYFHIYESDETVGGEYGSRKDEDVYSFSVGGTPVPIEAFGIADHFSFYGQYVGEKNGSAGRKVDAEAYYIEPGWTFTELPAAPHVFYRYSHFSGQSDPNDTTKRSYDPLFYGTGTRASFGTYFLGEIVGQYVLFNSNENVHQVGVTLNPTFHLLDKNDSLKIDLFYYNISFDKLNDTYYFTTPTSKDVANEFDVVGEYQYNAATYIAMATGVAFPGKGIKEVEQQAIGALSGAQVTSNFNKPTYLAEAYITYQF